MDKELLDLLASTSIRKAEMGAFDLGSLAQVIKALRAAKLADTKVCHLHGNQPRFPNPIGTALLTYSYIVFLQYFTALSNAAVPLVTAPESKPEDLLAILFTLSKVRRGSRQ